MSTAPTKEALEEFARKLHAAMTKKGFSQSDLARAVWGTVTDKRGYEVAKNRDQVSQYLHGKSLPGPENLQKLANALGVATEDLAPPNPGPLDKGRPAVSMTAIAGSPDRVRLTVDMVVSLKVAVAAMGILSE